MATKKFNVTVNGTTYEVEGSCGSSQSCGGRGRTLD